MMSCRMQCEWEFSFGKSNAFAEHASCALSTDRCIELHEPVSRGRSRTRLRVMLERLIREHLDVGPRVDLLTAGDSHLTVDQREETGEEETGEEERTEGHGCRV
jgi:hypothetical protein